MGPDVQRIASLNDDHLNIHPLNLPLFLNSYFEKQQTNVTTNMVI